MVRSNDYGKSWIDLGDVFAGQHASAFCALPGGIVLAGTDQGGIFRSDNYGGAWREMNSGYVDSEIDCIAHTLPDPNGQYSLLYAGTGYFAHILQSADGGLNWTDKGSFASGEYIVALVFTGGQTFVAAMYYACQVLISTDLGNSWHLGPVIDHDDQLLSLYCPQPHVVLAGTDGGEKIYRSTDDGQTFSLVFNPNRTGKILCFLDLGGGVIEALPDESNMIFKSTDYGQSWEILTDNINIINPTNGAAAGNCKACVIGILSGDYSHSEAYIT